MKGLQDWSELTTIHISIRDSKQLDVIISLVYAALEPTATTAAAAGKGSYGLQAPTTTCPEKARLVSSGLANVMATASPVASAALCTVTGSGPRHTRGPHTRDSCL